MKVLVNTSGWEMDAEPEADTPEAAAVKPGSGIYAKAEQKGGERAEPTTGDFSPESFSPTEPAPPSDDAELDVALPPPPSLPKFE